MERELKFRAWNKKTNNWFTTELPFVGFSLFGECTLICPPRVEDLQHIEVTQFTGLTDKNGKEIYEGDILTNDVCLWVVVFNKGCFCHKRIGARENETELALRALVGAEVIGNIYENPELLK